MKFALIGFVQKDILNPANLGITPSSYFISQVQDYISQQMTEDNGYLNVVFTAISNGRTVDEYAKSAFADTVTDPFCIENTEGYGIELDLTKQAPIPRYYLKTSSFDIFNESLEVRPYRIDGDFVAHIRGTQPSFIKVLNQNVQMGFNQYEVLGAWTKEALLHTVRKMLERDTYVDIKTDLIACDEEWEADLKEYCNSFYQTGQLGFK
jgi:nicotinamidase-related amidase